MFYFLSFFFFYKRKGDTEREVGRGEGEETRNKEEKNNDFRQRPVLYASGSLYLTHLCAPMRLLHSSV